MHAQCFRTLTIGLLFVLAPLWAMAETPPTNSTIAFQFRAAQVNGTPLVQTPGAGRLVCRSTRGITTGATYQTTFDAGAGGGTLDVAHEFSPYRCRTTFNANVGAASLFTTPSFDLSGTTEDIFIFAKNRRVRIELQTPTGEPVTGIPAKVTVVTAFREVNPYNPPARPFIVDTKTVDAETGRVQFSVVGDEVYRITVRPGSGSSVPGQSGSAGGGVRAAFTAPNGGRYFSEPSSFLLPFPNPSSDTPLVRPFLLQPANSNIQVTLYDVDNSTSIAGYVSVTSRALSEEENSFQLKASGRIEAGKSLILPAIQGRTFRVEVGALKSETSKTFNPAPAVVRPLDEEGEILNLSTTRPNYSLLINPKLLDSNDNAVPLSSVIDLTCFAFNARRERSSSDELSPKGLIELSLRTERRQEAESYRVGCRATVPSDEGTLQLFGLIKYRSKPNERKDRVNIRLRPTGTAYPLSTEEVSVSQFQEIIFPDGDTSLEISPGAFGDSGSAEISLFSATDFQADIDSIPLEAWEITPSVNGTLVSTPNNSVELCMPINASMVAEYGVSEEAVSLARYDEEEQRWKALPTSRVGESGNRYACGNLDHFSIFGTILEVASTLQDSVPQNLSIRVKRKGNQQSLKCIFSWEGPDTNADLLTYNFRFKKNGSKKICNESLEDDFQEFVVAGKTRATFQASKSCCGEVQVQESTFSSERKFKKAQTR